MPKLPKEIESDYWRFIMAPYRDNKNLLLKESVAAMLNRYDWS